MRPRDGPGLAPLARGPRRSTRVRLRNGPSLVDRRDVREAPERELRTPRRRHSYRRPVAAGAWKMAHDPCRLSPPQGTVRRPAQLCHHARSASTPASGPDAAVAGGSNLVPLLMRSASLLVIVLPLAACGPATPSAAPPTEDAARIECDRLSARAIQAPDGPAAAALAARATSCYRALPADTR